MFFLNPVPLSIYICIYAKEDIRIIPRSASLWKAKKA